MTPQDHVIDTAIQETAGDFSLDRSRWWNVTGLERTASWVRHDAESAAHYATSLARYHDYDPKSDVAICDMETALMEALLAVQLAKNAFQKKRPTTHLVAAE